MQHETEKTHPIVKEPHKVLRKKAAEVTIREITAPKIRDLVALMKTTLAATPDGVGLAAPQIGKSLAIFIVSEEAEEIDRSARAAEVARARRRGTEGTDIATSAGTRSKNAAQRRQRPWKYYTFINPVVKNSSRRKQDGPEGCLSVPGKFGIVGRQEKITVTAYDETGKKFTRGASRFFAQVMQHELDHLQGTLFIDKAAEIFSSGDRNQ